LSQDPNPFIRRVATSGDHQTQALLAVAYELRTQNMLAALNSVESDNGDHHLSNLAVEGVNARDLSQKIIGRLGLEKL
jgi:hypothetical protein